MTVYDVLVRASAQQYGGEAQTDEIEDEATQALYMEYVNEGMRRIWRAIDPIDVSALPEISRAKCPELTIRQDLGIYDARVFDALADYVTWRMLGTGNQSKQARGDWYYARFTETLSRLPKDKSWDEYYRLTGGGNSLSGRQGFTGVWSW